MPDEHATTDDTDPLEAQPIEPAAPEEFGLVQVWWGRSEERRVGKEFRL